jgi:hypothetical protein
LLASQTAQNLNRHTTVPPAVSHCHSIVVTVDLIGVGGATSVFGSASYFTPSLIAIEQVPSIRPSI